MALEPCMPGPASAQDPHVALFESLSEAHYLPALTGSPHDEALLASLVEQGCEDNHVLAAGLAREAGARSPASPRRSMSAAQGLLHLHRLPYSEPPDLAMHLPIDLHGDLSSALHGDLHSVLPADLHGALETELHGDLHGDLATDMHGDLSAGLHSDMETDLHGDLSGPGDLPSDITDAIVNELPRTMSSEIPCDLLSEITSEMACEMTSETACERKSDIPSEIPCETNGEMTNEPVREVPHDTTISAGLTESDIDKSSEVPVGGDVRNEVMCEGEVGGEELAPKLEALDAELAELEFPPDDSPGAVELVPTDLRVNVEKKRRRKDTTETTTPVRDTFLERSYEQPRDLSVPRRAPVHASPRPPSRESDAAQSPQPSGIPAVPCSPEHFAPPAAKSKQTLFLESLLSSPSPKMYTSEVTITKQQCEPLNLGKHRKSASPTVTSCSDEIKTIDKDFGEPQEKKVKRESSDDLSKQDKSNEEYGTEKSDQLPNKIDIDESPLQQLQNLKKRDSNIPDPLLVPKDKLNMIISAPAVEISALLMQRPELRLPEAFSYPNVLQDPDILVISLAQLEKIIENDAKKAEAEKHSENRAAAPKHTPTSTNKEKCSRAPSDSTSQPRTTPAMDALAGDIDAATSAALNQMLWLPYLSQLEAMAACSQNMDFLKALHSSGYLPPNHSDLSQMFPGSRLMNPAGMPMMSPMDYDNRMQFAMWQESMNHSNNSASQRPRPPSMDAQMKEMSSKSTDVQNPYVHSTKSHQGKSHSAARTSPIAHNYNNQRAMNHNPYLQGMYPGMNPTMRHNVPLPGLQIPYFNPNMMGSQRSPRTPQQKSPTSPYFPNNNYLQSLKQTESPSQQQRSGSVGSQESPRPRISVKSLQNLLEPATAGGRRPGPPPTGAPAAPGRRRDEPEVGSTTPADAPLHAPPHAPLHGMPPLPHDPASFHLWHPLFGNHKSYNSPWSWTTVTATGD